MRILLDMDDICVELLEEWTHNLNKISTYHKEPEDIINWDMRLAYPDLEPKSIYNCLNYQSFWENVKPVKDAYKYIKFLMDEGHDIYIATASIPSHLFIKTEYCLFKIFDYLTPKQIISIHDKSLLNADVLFDDYHENLRNFKGIKIMRNAAYNMNCDEECYDFRISRDNTWEEFYNLIKRIESLRGELV